MSRWFRYYGDALNDPKVQRLSGDLFKAWVNLLCLASQSEGKINSLSDAAFALRLPEAKAGAVVAQLARNGLMDPVTGGYFEPHNWGERQYKTDVTDPTNAKRQKRYRERHAVTVNTVTVTDTRADTEQIQIDDGEDAGARGEISRQAFATSEKLISIFGFDREFIPPGWCGAPRWVQKCLNEGIPEDVIISSAEGVKGRKRDGPPESFIYLEKPLARDWARQRNPLPTVQITPETINDTASTRQGRGGISPITAALDRFIATGEGSCREAIDGGEIRETPPRLLSHRGG
jgi:hypothetical protein